MWYWHCRQWLTSQCQPLIKGFYWVFPQLSEHDTQLDPEGTLENNRHHSCTCGVYNPPGEAGISQFVPKSNVASSDCSESCLNRARLNWGSWKGQEGSYGNDLWLCLEKLEVLRMRRWCWVVRRFPCIGKSCVKPLDWTEAGVILFSPLTQVPWAKGSAVWRKHKLGILFS